MRHLSFSFVILFAASARADLHSLPAHTREQAVFCQPGLNAGAAGMSILQTPSGPEVFLTSDFGAVESYAWRSSSASMVSRFITPSVAYDDGAVGVEIGDVVGDPAPEIVVANGESNVIRVFDSVTRELIESISVPHVSPGTVLPIQKIALADLDGDGKSEILVCRESRLWVYSGSGPLLWFVQVPPQLSVMGTSMVVAQMDDDPALEIATDFGVVIDAATHGIQAVLPGLPGTTGPRPLLALDVDGDGRAELFTIHDNVLTQWNVESQSIAATHVLPDAPACARLVDIDHDGNPELVLGDAALPRIQIVRASDATVLSTIHVPASALPPAGRSINNFDFLDVDGDGDVDLVCCLKAYGSNAVNLVTEDLGSQTVTWESTCLTGPYAGPVLGDVDGDGVDDLVAVSKDSDGYESGPRIVVMDPTDLTARAISPAHLNGGVSAVNDVRLFDVDGDGDEEILFSGDAGGQEKMEIWDYHAPNTFQEVWSMPAATTPPAVHTWTNGLIADLDGDGRLEVIAASNRIQVRDFLSSTIRWEYILSVNSRFTRVEVGDVDNDGSLEIVALESSFGHTYVFDSLGNIEAIIPTNGAQTLILGSAPPGLPEWPSIITGDALGRISVLRPVSGIYTTLAQAQVASAPLIDLFQDRRVLAEVSDGRLHIHRGLSAVPAWTSGQYAIAATSRICNLPGPALHLSVTNDVAVLGF